MDHDQQHYAQVAEACTELATKIPNTFTNEKIIGGDDASLPLTLRQLDSNEITVETNRVSIMIHDSRLGFGIVWEQNNSNDIPSRWELATYEENMRKVVFSK